MSVRSVNPVVGETNDGGLNDIRRRYITKEHVLQAIERAETGTVKKAMLVQAQAHHAWDLKEGSALLQNLPDSRGGYTVGVLVQTNFGGIFRSMEFLSGLNWTTTDSGESKDEYKEDGSCMIVIMTDAPLSPKNLKRLAARSMFGIARTGGIASNSSGDFAIAVSTAKDIRIPYSSDSMYEESKVLRNDNLDILFEAVIEATEEAIINSLFAAKQLLGKAM